MLPFIYFKSGIIDPWFNLFIFLGIYHFTLILGHSLQSQWFDRINIRLSGFFIGLGIFTKGPVALLVFGLVGFVFLFFAVFVLSFVF